MDIVDEKYLKGFNDGFLLKEHKPKLIEIILTTKTNNQYIEGLKDGKNAFEKNKLKLRYLELTKSHFKNQDRDIER
tara:strand:+ start:1742 stop:1969 length:228 start_codon:yes stop_codon:yes gene_type:complete